MKITFITGNKNKFKRAKELIPNIEQSVIDLVEIQSIDPKEIIEHKLQEAKKFIKGNIVVEDTSLYMECLNGLPGPLIKWFLKTVGNKGLAKIAEDLGNNKAEAKVIVGFEKENGSKQFFEGSIQGKIVRPRGENGFGWDPIFEPNGWDKTFAEMTPKEKNESSMRRVAFQKLANSLL